MKRWVLALALTFWGSAPVLATGNPPVVTSKHLVAAGPAAREAFGLCVKTAVEACVAVQCRPDPPRRVNSAEVTRRHERCVRPYARCLGRHVQECGARHIPGVAR